MCNERRVSLRDVQCLYEPNNLEDITSDHYSEEEGYDVDFAPSLHSLAEAILHSSIVLITTGESVPCDLSHGALHLCCLDEKFIIGGPWYPLVGVVRRVVFEILRIASVSFLT